MSIALAKRQLIEPDYLTGPKYVRTYGPVVADLLAKAGYPPDPQQELCLDRIHAIDAEGRCACFAFCEICCRQNLKTGVMKMATIGWLYVLDERDVTWSTHEMHTTRRAQKEIAELIEGSPFLAKRLKASSNSGIYDANGEERIELATGQTLWFKARTRDGMRGVSGRKLVLDEGFALTAAQVGSVLPTLTAAPDGQVIYGSSAGKASSEVLRDLRERGRVGTSPRLTYVEWCAPREDCADEDCDHPKDAVLRGIDCALDREHLMLKANPTISTGRITLQTIKDMRQELAPEEFMRECLGWWDEPASGAGETFGPGRWEAGATQLEFPEAPAAIGVAVSVDRTSASIAAAAMVELEELDEDGEPVERVFVAENQRRDDTAWLVAEVKRIQDEYDCTVVADEKGPVADLRDAFEEADVAIEWIDLGEYADACAGVYLKVRNGELLHSNGPELNAAVEGAEWRWVGDRRVWGRRKSTTDVAMLEAATCAVKGAEDLGVGIW